MIQIKKIFFLICILLIPVILIILSFNKQNNNTFIVQIEKVKRGKIMQIVSGTGRLKPKSEVKISANVAARIKRLYVKEGAKVNSNMRLIDLDRTRYEAAVTKARANLSAAKTSAQEYKASMDLSLRELKRKKKLYNKKLTTREALENTFTEYKIAKSRHNAALDHVTQAQATLDETLDDFSKTTIRSPMTGTVTRIYKEEGEIALGSQFQEDVIMIISDLSNIEAIVNIDENDIMNISLKDKAAIRVDALVDDELNGVVSEISRSAKIFGKGTLEEIVNFEVKVAVLDNIVRILSGMSVNVDIITDIKYNTLKIPIQAVTSRKINELKDNLLVQNNRDGIAWAASEQESKDKNEIIEVVFIVKGNTVKMQPVKTGIVSKTEIEILDGLSEQNIIVAGSYRVISKELKNNSKVQISNAYF